MTNRSMFTDAAVAASATCMIRSTRRPSFAAESPARASYGKPAATAGEKELIRTSSEVALAMRYLRNARLKIVDGLPRNARVFAAAALARMDAALANDNLCVLDIREASNALGAGEAYVPFIANLAIVDDVVPNEAKSKYLRLANEYLHKGEPWNAIHALRRGKIEVVMTSEMVPLKSARARVASAVRRIRAGRYVEAKLDLKMVEDSVVIETFGIDEIPEARRIASRDEVR